MSPTGAQLRFGGAVLLAESRERSHGGSRRQDDGFGADLPPNCRLLFHHKPVRISDVRFQLFQVLPLAEHTRDLAQAPNTPPIIKPVLKGEADVHCCYPFAPRPAWVPETRDRD